MERFIYSIILVVVMTITSNSIHAQSVNNNMKNVTTGASTNSATASIATLTSSVIGTKDVKASELIGTWNYTQPCMIFESNEILAKLKTGTIANKGQTYLQKGLQKAGFNPGAVSISFNNDSITTISMGDKTINGIYYVNGNELTLKYTGILNGVTKSVTANLNMDGKDLQIAMSAKKLLTFIQTVSSTASSANTTLSTVASLFTSVNGMYTGLQFEKK